MFAFGVFLWAFVKIGANLEVFAECEALFSVCELMIYGSIEGFGTILGKFLRNTILLIPVRRRGEKID